MAQFTDQGASAVQRKLIQRFSAPVPRYTSYPTAPHFSAAVGAATYQSWLRDLHDGARLSLYVHIPFCQSLCFYCGCSTKATRRYGPIADYLPRIEREMTMVAGAITPRHVVSDIHWGGGSPNALAPADIERLAAHIRRNFHVSDAAEFAVEIDPRHLTQEQVDAFRAAGVTRVSLGVQDVDEAVQAAINRQQPFEVTERAVQMCRDAGIGSLSIDLIYGLPYQTRASLTRTVERVLTLRPDRLAVFGYAHLPARFKHQRLLPEGALPDAQERFGQSSRIARLLTAAGYRRVGLDHYARPGDALAEADVRRNFQGYTTDAADALIGIGASAIGRMPQGFVQNAPVAGDYMRTIDAGRLATARGLALSEDDRVRAHVIERLMCDFGFDAGEVRARFGEAANAVIEESEALSEADPDGLLMRTGDGFRIRPGAEPFVRTICSVFDAYLGTREMTHSTGV